MIIISSSSTFTTTAIKNANINKQKVEMNVRIIDSSPTIQVK